MNTSRNFRLLVILFSGLLFSQCQNSPDNSTTTNNTVDTIIQTTPSPEKKSNEQIITEGVLSGIETLAANKRYKDSMRMANKSDFWVYTIGVPYEDLDQVAEAYGKLGSIEHIAVYDNSGEYSLIYLGTSKEELEDMKGSFKEQLKDIGLNNSKVEIVNLSLKCKTRDNIVMKQSRKMEKRYPEMVCFLCN